MSDQLPTDDLRRYAVKCWYLDKEAVCSSFLSAERRGQWFTNQNSTSPSGDDGVEELALRVFGELMSSRQLPEIHDLIQESEPVIGQSFWYYGVFRCERNLACSESQLGDEEQQSHRTIRSYIPVCNGPLEYRIAAKHLTDDVAMVPEGNLHLFTAGHIIKIGADKVIALPYVIGSLQRDVPAIEAIDWSNHTVEFMTPSVENAARATAIEPHANRFALHGDYWQVRFQNENCTIKNTLGVRYIARLLAQPGVDMLVSDLYYAVNPPPSASIGAGGTEPAKLLRGEPVLFISDLGDAGEALTPEGKARLRKALDDLTEQIADARECGDEELQEELEARQEAVLDRVRKDSGLGGRSRKTGSQIERLRKAVSKRIRADIERLRQSFPALGNHLEQTLHTGTQCSYTPSPPVAWDIET